MSAHVDRVLVVAPNWLGDAVMALPAIDDVRRHYPTADVVIAARGSVGDLFRVWVSNGPPDLSAVAPAKVAGEGRSRPPEGGPHMPRPAKAGPHVLDLEWRGQVWRRGALSRDIGRIRDLRPDVAVLLTNSFATAWLARQAAVPERWGYATDLRRLLLSRPVRRPRGSVHQGRYYQHLVRSLGITNGPLTPTIAVTAAAIGGARQLLEDDVGAEVAGPVIVLAPGAAYGTAKRWLPTYFARLATDLVRELNARCVLVGSGGDLETIRAVCTSLPEETRSSVTNLGGRTSLGILSGLLALARACVSNDSGTMHLAAAVGTPVAALFGPTNEKETAPLAHTASRAEVLVNPVWCRPCMLRECPIDHRCMRGLDPQRVFGAVRQLLAAGTALDS